MTEIIFPPQVVARWPFIGSCVTLFLSVWIARILFRPKEAAKIPNVGKGSRSARVNQFKSGAAWDLYLEGYDMIKKGADLFRIATTAPSETIVVSSKYLNELRKLPDDVLSSSEALAEVMQSAYTTIDVDIPGLPHTVKASLTPALQRLNPIISDEVDETLVSELPVAEEWTEVNVFSKLLRIVAIVSGRIFVGPELCHDERYIDAAINYTIEVTEAAREVATISQWIRPFLAPLHPTVKRVKKRLVEAIELLGPVVVGRLEAMKQDVEKPDDMLQWIIDDQVARGQTDAKALAKMQLGISLAAIHTTTLTTTNALYTLAAMPDLIPMLREDVQQALDAAGGQFTSSSMQNMKKLDSFLKEVMRYHPLSSASFHRKVLKPITLSSGQHIPAGYYLEVASGGMSFDEEFFPRANEFDALRYYKLRQTKDTMATHTKMAEVVANSQFVSVGSTSLLFGYGRHACPGRFFATNEMKMIMGHLLMNYDITNPPGMTGRHKNQTYGAQHLPDPSKSIMMKKRTLV